MDMVMKRPLFFAVLCTALSLAGCGGGGSNALSGSNAAPSAAMGTESVCQNAGVGEASCTAILRNDVGLSTLSFMTQSAAHAAQPFTPYGYGPSQLHAAYGISTTGGDGKTVAIVDAYDDPKAEADLAVYRAQFGLPACTTANGCFKKVAQDGSTHYPTASASWAGEISLDIDMASAICPSCHILLVEANSSYFNDLGAAVNRAVSLHATSVSNSYGGSEFSSESQYDTAYFNHPGTIITASAGDSAYGVEYPAASKYVVAVGGTQLTTASGARGWAETAWAGTGSGCSAYESKPSWQKDTGCKNRMLNDVSFDASPQTPVAVYQSYCGGSVCGWVAYGGTSVSSPAIAAAFALAGNASGAQTLYSAKSSNFHDITSGSNGRCSVSYFCNAVSGYDGPTGLGTPSGIVAF